MRKYKITLILFFLSFSYVFGTGFNVGIYNLDNDLKFDLYNFCSKFFQYKFVLSEKEIQYQEELNLYNKTLLENQQIKESYAKNIYPDFETEKNDSEKEDLSKINFIEVDPIEKCNSFIIDGDEILLNHICLEQDLSLLIIPQTVVVSDFVRYRIFIFNNIEKTFNSIYDQLLPKTQLNLENEDLLNAISPAFYSNYCLVEIVGDNFDSTLVKPGDFTVYDNLVILPSGNYTIDNFSFEVKNESSLKLSIKKDLEFSEDVLLNSKIGNLEILLNNYLQFKTPLKLDEVELPYTLKITKEGFKDSLIQVSDNVKSFEFDLSPSWQIEQNQFQEARKEFYNSFALSIGLFALRVVSKSLKEDNFKLYSGIDSFVYGVSIVNLLNVANKLFIYYKSSAFLAP